LTAVAQPAPHTAPLPENMSSQAFELILVELKAKRPAGKPAQ
jgi:hypothetical protein